MNITCLNTLYFCSNISQLLSLNQVLNTKTQNLSSYISNTENTIEAYKIAIIVVTVLLTLICIILSIIYNQVRYKYNLVLLSKKPELVENLGTDSIKQEINRDSLKAGVGVIFT